MIMKKTAIALSMIIVFITGHVLALSTMATEIETAAEEITSSEAAKLATTAASAEVAEVEEPLATEPESDPQFEAAAISATINTSEDSSEPETVTDADVEAIDAPLHADTSNPSLQVEYTTSAPCGDNASWSITGTGSDLTLTISGTGETYDYTEVSIPWASIRSKIKHVVVSEGITSIGEYLFYSLNQLTDVALPDTLRSIGFYAFSNCVSLEHIALPDQLESVGFHAFADCGKLREVVIPDTVTVLDTGAFENCTSLTSFAIPEGMSTVACALLYGCSNLTSVTIPEGVTVIESEAFSECGNLKSITLPESLTEIGVGAFHVCKGLTEVKIPDGVGCIEGYAFHLCSNLRSVTLPDGLTRIDEYAFAGCPALKNVEIPAGTTKIGNSAFEGCTSLTGITIPDSVTTIGYWAFRNCTKLQSITLPDSITSIGDCAFGYEDTPTSVRFRGLKEQWDAAVAEGEGEVHYKSIVYNCFSVPADFKLSSTAYTYTGKAITPSVTVTYQDVVLKEGVDYTLTRTNNTETGIATVNVNGIGDYFGTEPLYFKILPGATKKVTCTNVASGMKVSWEKVPGATRYKVYRNNTLLFTTSALNVTDKDVKYNGGKKYTYKVVAIHKSAGDSMLSRSAAYYRLMPVGIKSVTSPSAGKMTVTYDRSSGSSGYVVRYGLKSDMSDAKVITVKGQNTVSRTFSALQRGKIYYVQVRTYRLEKDESGTNMRYYSGYCTTKKVKIR